MNKTKLILTIILFSQIVLLLYADICGMIEIVKTGQFGINNLALATISGIIVLWCVILLNHISIKEENKRRDIFHNACKHAAFKKIMEKLKEKNNE